jgi:purine-nucleoside phosphorylase
MPDPVLTAAELEARLAETLAAIRRHSTLEPRVAITLGSGLGAVADAVEDRVALPTRDLPHWPRSTVPGHAGRLVLGHWQGVPVAALSGRSHRYEGYTLARVTYGVRVMHRLGARVMVFTNSVGSLNREFAPGELMLARDHVNFIGKRGLLTTEELAERRLGRRVAHPYAPRLARALLDAAREAHVALRQGVLMGGHGPAYETAAEIRMAQAFGADVACMSTVHEVTLAAHLGCEVASISCITNRATGMSETPLTHDEVTLVAHQAADRLRAVLERYLAAARADLLAR